MGIERIRAVSFCKEEVVLSFYFSTFVHLSLKKPDEMQIYIIKLIDKYCVHVAGTTPDFFR